MWSKLLSTAIVGILSISLTAAADPEHDECATREELAGQYEKLAEANARRDLKAILELRSADFSTIGPDGTKHDTQHDTEYVKQLVSAMEPPVRLINIIIDVKTHGNEAAATVFQRLERRQSIGGKVRNVLTSVIQTETWVKTAGVWKLRYVEKVHNRRWYVDGKRIDPSKPFDPDAPPYNPDIEADLSAN
jgi:hypothetical protein